MMTSYTASRGRRKIDLSQEIYICKPGTHAGPTKAARGDMLPGAMRYALQGNDATKN